MFSRRPAPDADKFNPKGALWKVVVLVVAAVLIALLGFLSVRDPEQSELAAALSALA